MLSCARNCAHWSARTRISSARPLRDGLRESGLNATPSALLVTKLNRSSLLSSMTKYVSSSALDVFPKYPFQDPFQPGFLRSPILSGQKGGQVFALVKRATPDWFALKYPETGSHVHALPEGA